LAILAQTNHSNQYWFRVINRLPSVFNGLLEGVFDYVKYLKEMQKVGYTGFISPEISIMV